MVLFDKQEFGTPSGKIEIASEQAVKMGLPRTPQAWADNPSEDGAMRLLTPASKWRLNDSYANDPHLIEQSGPAEIHLSPTDANRLGIADSDSVTVSNETGSIELNARINDDVLAGTAVSYKGRWPKVERSGTNINFLHGARMADMGESTSVHSTEVIVRGKEA